MGERQEFIKAFDKVLKGMGKDRIQQIQEGTLLLINQKYRMMKKFMYVPGMIAPSLLIIGTISKILHLPGAGIMITLSGIVTVFVFIPILVIQAVKDKENQVRNFTILIFVLSFVAITFMMFSLKLPTS